MSEIEGTLLAYINNLNISPEQKSRLIESQPKSLSDISLWLSEHKDDKPQTANSENPFAGAPTQNYWSAQNPKNVSLFTPSQFTPTKNQPAPIAPEGLVDTDDASWGLALDRTGTSNEAPTVIPFAPAQQYNPAVQAKDNNSSEETKIADETPIVHDVEDDVEDDVMTDNAENTAAPTAVKSKYTKADKKSDKAFNELQGHGITPTSLENDTTFEELAKNQYGHKPSKEELEAFKQDFSINNPNIDLNSPISAGTQVNLRSKENYSKELFEQQKEAFCDYMKAELDNALKARDSQLKSEGGFHATAKVISKYGVPTPYGMSSATNVQQNQPVTKDLEKDMNKSLSKYQKLIDKFESCKTKEEFEKEYKKAFGVDYDPQKINYALQSNAHAEKVEALKEKMDKLPDVLFQIEERAKNGQGTFTADYQDQQLYDDLRSDLCSYLQLEDRNGNKINASPQQVEKAISSLLSADEDKLKASKMNDNTDLQTLNNRIDELMKNPSKSNDEITTLNNLISERHDKVKDVPISMNERFQVLQNFAASQKDSIYNKYKNTMDKATGGKGYEGYKAEVKQANEEAFGTTQNSNIMQVVKEYSDNVNTAAGVLKTGAGIALLPLSIATGGATGAAIVTGLGTAAIESADMFIDGHGDIAVDRITPKNVGKVAFHSAVMSGTVLAGGVSAEIISESGLSTPMRYVAGVASDMVIGAEAELATTGTISKEGMLLNGAFSAAGQATTVMQARKADLTKGTKPQAASGSWAEIVPSGTLESGGSVNQIKPNSTVSKAPKKAKPSETSKPVTEQPKINNSDDVVYVTTENSDVALQADGDGAGAAATKQNSSKKQEINTYISPKKPKAKLVQYSYKDNKGNVCKLLAAENISVSERQTIINIDNKRRILAAANPYYATKLSKNAQISIAQKGHFSGQTPNINNLIYAYKGDEAKIMSIIKNPERFDATMKDISEMSKVFDKPADFQCLDGLLEIKQSDPAKYQKIMDSGIVDMIKNDKLDVISLRKLNKNSDLSDDIYNDLQMLKEGKDFVPSFKAGTEPSKAFEQTKVGDAVEIGDKMYINDGNGLVEWNMTKDKYLELFPPVQRFATVQGEVSNCHLIQTLGVSMHNPKARAQFLQSFSLQGDDVVVTVKGLEDYKGSHTFKNGEISTGNTRKHLFGCKGMQMYEQTYARVALRSNESVSYPAIEPVETLVQRTAWGHAGQTMADVYGQGAVNDLGKIQYYSDGKNYKCVSSYTSISSGNVPYMHNGNIVNANINQNSKAAVYELFDSYFENFPDKTLALRNMQENTFEALVEHTANNQDFLVSFGTISSPQGTESQLLPEYNIVSRHAYSILGYDSSTKTVKIANPHAYGETTEIPLSTLYKYVQHLDFLKL